MKRAFYFSIIFLSAAALTASCGQAIPESISDGQGERTYTLSVEASKVESPVTRALNLTTNSEGKHELNSFWETTDVISVRKWDRVIGTLSPKTSGSKAILTGTITGELRKEHILYLSWPGDGSYSDYTGQDGKLATIASRYDYITATTSVASIDDDIITCTPVTFTSTQAIVKFILKDGSGNPIYPNRLVLSASDGSGNSMLFTANGSRGQLAVNIDQGEEATNEVYVAIKQWSDASVFRINAYVNKDAGYVYRKMKYTTTVFTPGKYYEVTVNMGTKEVDTGYTLDNFSFDFDFGESARKWPVFVFFDDITTGYWYDPDGSGASAGSFIDLGGTVASDLAQVKKVTAVSMPRWTNQTPVYSEGRWTFGNIQGWEYIAQGKVSCEYALVEGNPCLSADITLAAPEVTGKEIRVYNNEYNTKVACNNLIPMGLAYISSDGMISEVSEDTGGWISLVRDSENNTTYGYAREVSSPTEFTYLALKRTSGSAKSYYHMTRTAFKTGGYKALSDYTVNGVTYSVVQDNNGLDWIQVGSGHYATVGGMTWWTTNLAADRYNPEPHPWTSAVLSWAPATDNQFAADRKSRSLSEATFYGNSELPSINSNYMTFFSTVSAHSLRACGVDGVVMVDNADNTKFIFLAVPDREDYEFVYYYSYYNSQYSYIVYKANDYYWAKEYDPDQARQQLSYDGSYGADYWNLYRTSAININFKNGTAYPPYRFPYAGTGVDGYGLPDFGCSAESIEGRLQPLRIYLPARPVKK